jgi:hypothetical protein
VPVKHHTNPKPASGAENRDCAGDIHHTVEIAGKHICGTILVETSAGFASAPHARLHRLYGIVHPNHLFGLNAALVLR